MPLTLLNLRLRIWFFLLAFIIGFIHAWILRFTVDFDGMANLEIADELFNGNWKAIFYSYWSPLYPIIIGFFLNLFKPIAYWESTTVHFVNFFIYLIAFFCFDFFLKQLTQSNRKKEEVLPEWAILALGYSLFIWSSMNLITLSRIMSDMSSAAVLYLVFGLLLKIKSGKTSWMTFIFFGIVLGLFYMSKISMIPLILIFLFCSFFAMFNFKSALPRVITSFLIFVLIISPFVFLLSKSKGYFTVGDAGKLNYAEEVMEEITICPTSKSRIAQFKNLVHPVRKTLDRPAVFEYSTPFKVTYPPYYDPSYWWQGLKLNFNLQGQLRSLLRSAKVYCDLFTQMQIILLAFFILFFISYRSWSSLVDKWILILPPLIAMFMCSLIHVEFRYIGAYVAIFLLGLFSALKLPDSKEIKKLVSCVIGIIVFFMIITSVFSLDLLDNFKNKAAYNEWIVSEELKKVGIGKADKVAVIPGECDIWWARLAKVHIIAEVSLEDKDLFWDSSDVVRSKVLQAFKNAGAKIVIAEEPPSDAVNEGWKKIKDTVFYFYVL